MPIGTTLLLVSTAGASTQVGLWRGGLLASAIYSEGKRNAQTVLGLVQRCLTDGSVRLEDCVAIVVDVGPGSFTGLRIGVASVQGLAYGADLPVLPLSSMMIDAQTALAQVVGDTGRRTPLILVAQAALQEEVYWGAYQAGETGLVSLVGEELILRQHSYKHDSHPDYSREGEVITVGSAWGESDWLGSSTGVDKPTAPIASPESRLQAMAKLAASLVDAGRSCSAAQLEPNYLKNDMGYRRA